MKAIFLDRDGTLVRDVCHAADPAAMALLPGVPEALSALADAGYVVAAPVHRGDNVEDSSGLSSPMFWGNRSQELRGTLDYLLNSWPGRSQLDPTRIGAFGFSAGGFTVLTAVGGRPNLRIIPFHCATQPEFVCDVLRAAGSPLLASTPSGLVGSDSIGTGKKHL